MRTRLTTAAMITVASLAVACGAQGDAAFTRGPGQTTTPTTAGPTVPKGRELPAGEPKPACGLFSDGEMGDLLGNPVRAGTGEGRNCLWATAVDGGSSVQLSVNTPGQARAQQACTDQRNSISRDLKQEELGGVGTSAVWATQQLTLLLQGTLSACFEDAVILVILTGERDEAAMRNTAVALARHAYSRL